MRVVGTTWLVVAVLVMLTFLLPFVALLTDGFDVGAIFMAMLMLVGAVRALFAAVLPSVAVATARGLWVYGRGSIPWCDITDMRVTGVPFTWLDGYAVEISTSRGDLTLFSTATQFAWGARRKKRALERIWKKRRGKPPEAV